MNLAAANELQRAGAQTQFLSGDPVAAVDAVLGRGHPANLGGPARGALAPWTRQTVAAKRSI